MVAFSPPAAGGDRQNQNGTHEQQSRHFQKRSPWRVLLLTSVAVDFRVVLCENGEDVQRFFNHESVVGSHRQDHRLDDEPPHLHEDAAVVDVAATSRGPERVEKGQLLATRVLSSSSRGPVVFDKHEQEQQTSSGNYAHGSAEDTTSSSSFLQEVQGRGEQASNNYAMHSSPNKDKLEQETNFKSSHTTPSPASSSFPSSSQDDDRDPRGPTDFHLLDDDGGPHELDIEHSAGFVPGVESRTSTKSALQLQASASSREVDKLQHEQPIMVSMTPQQLNKLTQLGTQVESLQAAVEDLRRENQALRAKTVLRGKIPPPHIEKVCFRKFVLLI